MASSDGRASRLGRAEPRAGAPATAAPDPEGQQVGRTTSPTSESPADLAQSFFSDDPSPGGPAIGRATPLGRLLAAIDPVSDSAMTYFYGHLFAIEPQIRAMFPPAM